jgi:hypothetical protein
MQRELTLCWQTERKKIILLMHVHKIKPSTSLAFYLGPHSNILCAKTLTVTESGRWYTLCTGQEPEKGVTMGL